MKMLKCKEYIERRDISITYLMGNFLYKYMNLYLNMAKVSIPLYCCALSYFAILVI